MRNDLLLLGAAPGLPRSGLVALYDPYRDTYGRNVLPVGCADFATGWSAVSGASVTVTTGQPDPDGGNNAYRIQASGGSVAVKYQITNGAFIPASISGIWLKVNSGSVSFSQYVAYTDLYANATWEKKTFTQAEIASNGKWRVSAADAGSGFDIVVYQPQLNLGSTLFPYSAPAGAPGTLQVCADRWGGLYPLQLGSGTSADAADPAFSGVSMLHAADYLLSGNIAGITMAGDWTLPLICKTAGTANTLVSLASAAAADQYQAIEYNGSTKVRIKTVNGATVTTSDDLTVSATAVQMLVLTSSGDTLTLKRMDTGTSVTATNADPTGTARLCIGALGINVVASAADALEWHLLLLYRRAWTAGEATKAYVYAKSLMARRGVTLA